MQLQLTRRLTGVFQTLGFFMQNGSISMTSGSPSVPRRSAGPRVLQLLLLSMATLSMAGSSFGGEHWTTQKCHYCKHKTCKLKVETETEKVACFEVECKEICIPPITFPWQCRPTSCGKVRTVHVLKPETQEKQVCKYSWEIVTICPSCSSSLKAAGCDIAPGVIQGWCDDLPVDQHH